jgi:hypothetical protein
MLRHLSYPYSQEKMAPEPPFGPDPPPIWSHRGRVQKTEGKKGYLHWASTGHETQFSNKFGFNPWFQPITAPAMCIVAINDKYISYPYLIKFHHFADNSH